MNSASIAYEFIAGLWADEELPEPTLRLGGCRPLFASDYARYCRAIQEGNAFIVSELTRPA
jgi:hypothetical protein